MKKLPEWCNGSHSRLKIGRESVQVQLLSRVLKESRPDAGLLHLS